MKLIFLLLFVFFSFKSISANQIEVFELHETKSLDQLVLDKINGELENNNLEENLATPNENSSKNVEQTEESINNQEEVSIQDIENNEELFFKNLSIEEIKEFLKYSNNIKSDVIKEEYYRFLLNLKLDLDLKKNREIFFTLVDYFYNIGEISYAYNLINSYDLSNDKNIAYYEYVEINYLLATYQLENLCKFKENKTNDLALKNKLFQKVEIFCLLLENKFSEADLFNALLIEEENNIDENFQQLYNLLIEEDLNTADSKIDFKLSDNQDLIYLYSAMSRIAEIPIDAEFLKIDNINLSIPIILNKSTSMDLRIKAANHAFMNKLITVDSLAALYQSVDFDNNQLENYNKTLKELNKNVEMSMALYFQYINIQIFPSERLNAVINFWNYAKENNLSNIAYSLTLKIIDSIDINSANAKYAAEIATSYILNNYYEKASIWIDHYEKNIGVDSKITNTKILLSLNSASEYDIIVKNIEENLLNSLDLKNKKNNELIFILHNILDENKSFNYKIDFQNIYDDRLLPSVFLNQILQNAINDEKYEEFLVYSVISLNGKNWLELHPQHLKLILKGYLFYNEGSLIKNLILEVIQNYKIL